MESNAYVPAIDELLQRFMWETEQRACRFERREQKRRPFPYPVRLIPVLMPGDEPIGKELTVIGHDLSHSGFRFYHTKPLPLRRAIVCLPSSSEHGLLLQLRWCRFLQPGWYESGGCFVGTVCLESESPDESRAPGGRDDSTGPAAFPSIN